MGKSENRSEVSATVGFLPFCHTIGSERSMAIGERLVWDPMVPSMSLDSGMSVRAQESIVVNMQSFSKDSTLESML